MSDKPDFKKVRLENLLHLSTADLCGLISVMQLPSMLREAENNRIDAEYFLRMARHVLTNRLLKLCE